MKTEHLRRKGSVEVSEWGTRRCGEASSWASWLPAETHLILLVGSQFILCWGCWTVKGLWREEGVQLEDSVSIFANFANLRPSETGGGTASMDPRTLDWGQ